MMPIESFKIFVGSYCGIEVMKSKIEYIEIDYKEFMENFFDEAERLFENPSSVINDCEVIVNTEFREKLPPIKIIFKNTFAELVPIHQVSRKYLHKLIKIKGMVQYKSQKYLRVMRVVKKCIHCDIVSSSFDNYCRVCKGTSFKREEIKNTTIKLTIREDSSELGTKVSEIITCYLPEYLMEKVESLTLGGKMELDCVVSEEKSKPGTYLFCLEVHNFEILNDGIKSVVLDDATILRIKEEVKKENFLDLISQSIFPNVVGIEEIRKSVVLQMVGSPKEWQGKVLRNRGNLMILLVGSPGVSKSVLLKGIAGYYPKAKYVSCSTASGIGLVAMVRKDEISGGYTAEAGAVPLAQGSICCIDELDKIAKDQLGFLNTALDSLEIPIDKADVHIKMPCDVSVLGALNPKYKIFEPNEDFYSQVDLPKDFMDRFDLIWGIDSLNNEETQDLISDRVLTPVQDMKVTYDLEFIHQYFAFSKIFNPLLTLEGKETIKEKYKEITKRSQEAEGARFSTRLLTNLLRLSGAFARARLSNEICKEDCLNAYGLLLSSFKSLHLVKEVNGQLQIDTIRLEKTEPRGKRDKMKVIEKILKDAPEPMPYKDIEDLIEFKDEFDELITKMQREGLIFEPRKGRYKLT